MRIELDMDDELVRRVMHITKERSVSDAIRVAVEAYVGSETAKGFREIVGKMEFDPEYLEERKRQHPELSS